MLPEVIKNGTLISDNVPNQHQNSTNKTFAYIAYDTAVEGIPVVIKLDIKKSPIKNKLWVHSIVTKKNSTGQGVYSKNGTVTPYRTDAIDDSIPQHYNSVNEKFSDRPTDSFSNRSLLSNALETTVQNDIEKNKLTELVYYRTNCFIKLKPSFTALITSSGPSNSRVMYPSYPQEAAASKHCLIGTMP